MACVFTGALRRTFVNRGRRTSTFVCMLTERVLWELLCIDESVIIGLEDERSLAKEWDDNVHMKFIYEGSVEGRL